MKIPEAYAGLARSARRQGWTITRTSNNHLRWTSPAGRSVFTPGSPSTNTLLPIIRKLQRAGLEMADH